MSSNNGHQLFLKNAPKSVISEAFRVLRTNLLLARIDNELNSIAVTSACRGEGKSTICANLALTIAQSEKKVLLLDCDLRLPTQANYFDLQEEEGLTSLVQKFRDSGEFVVNGEKLPNLTVLGSGPQPPNPSEFLGSKQFRAFFEKAKQAFDVVILDTPPIGLVTDAAVLSLLVDGVVMVIDEKAGHRKMALRAKKSLERVNANIIGVILNNVKQRRGAYSYHGKYS